MAEALAMEGIDSPVELGLVIIDGETIRELNRKYRGEDSPTDVLSFALLEGETFVLPPNGFLHLGDVFISYPQAIAQAQEYNHSIKQEIALLTIHGLLHLLGYEHDNPQSEQRMRTREEKILSEVGEWTS